MIKRLGQRIKCHGQGIKCHAQGIKCHAQGIKCHGQGIKCHGQGIKCHAQGGQVPHTRDQVPRTTFQAPHTRDQAPRAGPLQTAMVSTNCPAPASATSMNYTSCNRQHFLSSWFYHEDRIDEVLKSCTISLAPWMCFVMVSPTARLPPHVCMCCNIPISEEC
jgi:hypothetical protein